MMMNDDHGDAPYLCELCTLEGVLVDVDVESPVDVGLPRLYLVQRLRDVTRQLLQQLTRLLGALHGLLVRLHLVDVRPPVLHNNQHIIQTHVLLGEP